MSYSRHCRLACLLGVMLALLVALPGAGAQAALTAAVSQVKSDGFPTVVSVITIADGTGRPVLGLGPNNWEVFEDGRAVKDVSVGTAVNAQEPLTVLLAIDTSGSMNGQPMADAKGAATTFVQGLGPAEKAAVIAFAEQPVVVQGFTDRKDDLARAIGGLQAAGDTALYDAAILAAKTVDQQKGGRRIILLLTDGEDTKSKANLEEALPALQAAATPVFTVGLGPKAARDVLGSLAATTGGIALYAPSSADLQAAYRNIADQLRNQYVLTFTSSLPADGQRHALLARAKVGNAQTEARAYFVATSVPPQIEVVSPKAGETVGGKVRVEVKVQAAGKVKRVEATVAGRTVGIAESEPFVMEWDTSDLAAGNAILGIQVEDALGNRASKQVTVRVAGGPVAAPTPLPTPRPSPTATTADGNDDESLVLGGAGAFCVMALALVAVRRSRRAGQRSEALRWIRRETLPKNCPTCGRALKHGEDCPECRAKDHALIRQRLRELAGDEGADGLPPEDKP